MWVVIVCCELWVVSYVLWVLSCVLWVVIVCCEPWAVSCLLSAVSSRL